MYVHCHLCNWSQDDFWSWRGYNPLRYFLKNELAWLVRPRFIVSDPSYVSDNPVAIGLGLVHTRAVPRQRIRNAPAIDQYGTPLPEFELEWYEHSWFLLACAATKWMRRLFTQRWWTYKSWRQAVKQGRGGCPDCGAELCND